MQTGEKLVHQSPVSVSTGGCVCFIWFHFRTSLFSKIKSYYGSTKKREKNCCCKSANCLNAFCETNLVLFCEHSLLFSGVLWKRHRMTHWKHTLPAFARPLWVGTRNCFLCETFHWCEHPQKTGERSLHPQNDYLWKKTAAFNLMAKVLRNPRWLRNPSMKVQTSKQSSTASRPHVESQASHLKWNEVAEHDTQLCAFKLDFNV